MRPTAPPAIPSQVKLKQTKVQLVEAREQVSSLEGELEASVSAHRRELSEAQSRVKEAQGRAEQQRSRHAEFIQVGKCGRMYWEGVTMEAC